MAALLALGACAPGEPQLRCPNGHLVELVEAMGAQRFTEARLTCFDAWGPCAIAEAGAPFAAAPRCGGAPPRTNQDLARLSRIGRDLRKATPPGRQAQSLQAMGLWRLLWTPTDGSLEKAITSLRQASEQDPRADGVLSDLAAAYLTRAVSKGRPEDLFQALRHANRAIETEPRQLGALFNRALILERMFAESAAREAWESYLEVDTDSAWSLEARQRLALPDASAREAYWSHLRSRLSSTSASARDAAAEEAARNYPQQTRQHAEEILLPAWADGLVGASGTGSSAALLHAGELAKRLHAVTKDRLLLDSVGRISELQQRGDEQTRCRNAVPQALLLYRDGRRLHDQQRYVDSTPLLERASTALRACEVPHYLWADFFVAVSSYHAPDYEKAQSQLRRLQEVSAERDYVALGAYSHWMLGLIAARRSRHGLALDHFDTASTGFQDLGEIENLAAMVALSASIYFSLGDEQTAWSHLYQALSSRPRILSSRRLQNILAEAVDALREADLPEAALPYQTDLVELALASGNPLSTTLSLRRRARLLAGLGQAEAARADLAEAWRYSEEIPSPGLRNGVRADLLVAEAQLLTAAAPEEAVTRLSTALEVHLEARDRHLLIQILTERAAALIRLGRLTEALADLEHGAAELESQWRAIDREPQRRFLREQSRGLYESLIRIELARGNEETRALELVERMRALPGPIASPQAPPIGRLCAALPPQSAVLTYLVAGDELLAWVHANGCREPTLIRVAVSAEEIARLAARFYESLSTGNDPAAEALARDLGQLLIEPVWPHLRGARSLIVVPDGSLHDVPFSALSSPQAGRFLIEDFAVSTTPSLRALVKGWQRTSSTPPRSLLFVAEPEIDRNLFPALPALPSSLGEAASIGRLYDRSTVLSQREATPSRVIAALGGAEIFHFSGHSLLARGSAAPAASLLLAQEGEELARLSSDDLRRLDLGRTQLAFLGACTTAGGRVSSVAGSESLARAFLQAGVPAVVATLWDVEDRQAARLADRFHTHYSAGAPPAEALRFAQVEMLHNGSQRDRRPLAWAAFQLHQGAP